MPSRQRQLQRKWREEQLTSDREPAPFSRHILISKGLMAAEGFVAQSNNATDRKPPGHGACTNEQLMAANYDPGLLARELGAGALAFRVPSYVRKDSEADDGRLHIHKMYDFGEHQFIGDSLAFRLPGSNPSLPPVKQTLHFGLGPHDANHQYPVMLSYGQINALAGDIYGTDKPICLGDTPEDRKKRFNAAFDTLFKRQPVREVKDLLGYFQEEVQKVATDPKGAGKYYSDQSAEKMTARLDWYTRWRPSGVPNYSGLLHINYDHFGDDARLAYAAGHSVALERAVNYLGDANSPSAKEAFYEAYRYNAFADHFLEDLFAAGHLRTPRRILHGDKDIFYDLCANAMHNEDNAIGLNVKNAEGEAWRMYGDGLLRDPVNQDNYRILLKALQASVDEVYEAWSTRKTKDANHFAVWRIVATSASAHDLGAQDLAPLFLPDGRRRAVIENRRDKQRYTGNWWAWSTYAETQSCGWWKYKMTLDGGGA